MALPEDEFGQLSVMEGVKKQLAEEQADEHARTLMRDATRR